MLLQDASGEWQFGWKERLGGWLILGAFLGVAFLVSDSIAGRISSVAFVVVQGFLCGGLWILAAPWIWALARRFPFFDSRWRFSLALHLAMSVVFSSALTVAFATFFWGLYRLWEGTNFGFTNALRVSSYYFFLAKILYYWLVVVARVAYEQARKTQQEQMRAVQMKEQLTASRLQVLRMQMSPHFLFNSLNAVSSLIRMGERDTALQTVARLGDFLRGSLEEGEQAETSLEVELASLEHYLEVERCRFGERLTVRVHVEDELLGQAFPRWVLQPLVENAIVHGVEKNPAGGSIDVRVDRREGFLHLEVSDDGPGVETEVTEGIGLGNTRSRLRELYGEEFALQVSRGDSGGTVVSLRWPAREQSP